MQHITENVNLFDDNGDVVLGGWSRERLFEYNKKDFPAPNKLDEKDSYFISNGEMGFYLGVETLGAELAIRIVLHDYKTGEIVRDSITRKLVLDLTPLPQSEGMGEFSYTDKKIALTLTNTVEGRYIKCDFIDFNNYKNLFVKVVLKNCTGDSMNVIAPFDENHKCFYYKRFVPAFTASGVVRFGGTDYNLTDDNSYVYLNWSRYALFKHQKYQSLNAVFPIGGHKFAINLASKVGNNKKGSENCYFLDEKLYKAGRLKVSGDERRPDSEWRFESLDGGIDLVFTPDRDEHGIQTCKCDKLVFVFGTLNGRLDNSEVKLRIRNKKAQMMFVNI